MNVNLEMKPYDNCSKSFEHNHIRFQSTLNTRKTKNALQKLGNYIHKDRTKLSNILFTWNVWYATCPSWICKESRIVKALSHSLGAFRIAICFSTSYLLRKIQIQRTCFVVGSRVARLSNLVEGPFWYTCVFWNRTVFVARVRDCLEAIS